MADRTGRAPAGSPQQRNSAPFKYDIRVTGDLYPSEAEQRAATKVSVKILGNEDGDVLVEQDDARSLASPTPSTDGDTRSPQVTHKRLTDGGLELRIHALPVRAKKGAALETLAGGGNSNGTSNGSGNGSGNGSSIGAPTPVPSRIRAASSFASAPSSRPMTRLSEYMRSRPLSSHQSFMEIRPAFDDSDEAASDSEQPAGAQTPQSMERSASPVLVGGGAQPESRNRSASMTQVEDKCTMTTLRGLPDELRVQTLEKDAASDGEFEAGTRASSVLRGGGGGCCVARAAGSSNDVFSAFNGPPVAPPEACGHSRQQLRPRRASKDKPNYRQRVESLLTQYFPPEVLGKYLDELRHRYRFIGS
ncbi:hypothetical protein IWW55_005900, partial [Coemansia sp. RSA 2706]